MKEQQEQNQSESLPISIVRRIQKVFPSFDSSKLKTADFEIWRAVKAGKAKAEDYETYRRAVLKDEGRNASTLFSSRLMFSDFLGDAIQNKLFSSKLIKGKN